MKAIVARWRSMVDSWRPYVEPPVPPAAIAEVMQAASIPTFAFCFMLSLATAIATFGLLADSAPAIIGAMIIAPLMSPIISLSYGIVVLDRRMVARSAFAIGSGVLLVVLFAFLSAEYIGLRVVGSEILSRTTPTLLDLGVAVAAGAAGAFVHTRRGIANSIAGVAIAVALVPPLAVTGIGLSFGRQVSAEVGLSLSQIGIYSGGDDIAAGAFLLFLTNLIGIVACSALVLICHGYGQWKRALVGLVLFVGLSYAIIGPLHDAMYRLYVKSAALRMLSTLNIHRPELFRDSATLNSMHVQYVDGEIIISIELFLPRDDLPLMQIGVDEYQSYLSNYLNEEVRLQVEVIVIDTVRFRSSTSKEDEGRIEPEIEEAVD